jgi:hypothetical protein
VLKRVLGIRLEGRAAFNFVGAHDAPVSAGRRIHSAMIHHVESQMKPGLKMSIVGYVSRPGSPAVNIS